ncbi:MAG: hypothetical protein KatS3mg012_0161 [Gaiellaceae bacterium]|nr:MAG: hypothetical protein KatS3mg012_0161 [Gaiellaceae bacterium]
MRDDGYVGLRLETLLERLAAEGEAPGAGTGAALTVALAASVVAMAARCSTESWAEADGIAAQALAVRVRALELAHVDAEAWQRALAALERARRSAGGDPRRDFVLEQELARAAAAPLAIAELGADMASLAATTADSCEGSFRPDAAAAAALAAGAARAAAHLVEVNLAVRGDDPRLARARASARSAADAAEEAAEAGR